MVDKDCLYWHCLSTVQSHHQSLHHRCLENCNWCTALHPVFLTNLTSPAFPLTIVTLHPAGKRTGILFLLDIQLTFWLIFRLSEPNPLQMLSYHSLVAYLQQAKHSTFLFNSINELTIHIVVFTHIHFHHCHDAFIYRTYLPACHTEFTLRAAWLAVSVGIVLGIAGCRLQLLKNFWCCPVRGPEKAPWVSQCN